MTIFEAMAEVVQMARDKGELCYLYRRGPSGNFKWGASFQYWDNWLFKAYPGGRKVLSMEGKKLVQAAQSAQQVVGSELLPPGAGEGN